MSQLGPTPDQEHRPSKQATWTYPRLPEVLFAHGLSLWESLLTVRGAPKRSDGAARRNVSLGERLGGRQQICAAELLAVLLGLDIAKQNGWSYFMVKSDCLEVVSMVNSNEECFAGVLVEEVRGLLPLYNASGFSHVSRRAHGAAHEVAKKLTF
ncbi:hypothetical protein ACLB2K_032735 [Fragaria x ananassa]